MLLLLKARGFLSREELAQELQCSKRAILDYKKELEDAGYVIDSTTGKYGGYSLARGALLPVIGFREEESRALQESCQYMKSHQDFRLQKDFESAMDKILSNTPTKEESGVYMDVHAILSKRVLEMIQLCERAKQSEHVVELKYRSLRSNTVEPVVIHPYEILNYKQAYYCLAYSLKAKDYRIYKFSEERMKDCVVVDRRFQRERDFRLKDHIGQSGLVKDECFEIELYIYHETARVIAERSIGIDDKKEWINEHTLYVSTIMEGKIETISFLLSLKDQCTLLSPRSLKEEMLKILKDMEGVYSQYSETLL